MTEIYTNTSCRANSDLLLVVCLWSHETEDLLYFINNDEFSLVGHLWNYFWKMEYGLKILLFHSFFERWKLEINKRDNRLQKFMEISQTFKITQNLLKLQNFYRLKFKYIWAQKYSISER